MIDYILYGVVHKLRLQSRWVGWWSKIWKNCKLYSTKSQNFRQVGGGKSLKIANVICEWPPAHSVILLKYVSVCKGICTSPGTSVEKKENFEKILRSQDHLRIGRLMTHHRVHGGVLCIDLRRGGRMIRHLVVVKMIRQSRRHLLQVVLHRSDAFANEYQNE